MTIRKDSLALLVSRAAILVSAMAVSVIVSRVLGPTQRGVYFMALVINGVLTSLCSCGVEVSNLHLLSKRRTSLTIVNSHSLALAVGIGAAVVFAYAIIGPAVVDRFLPNLKHTYVWAALAMVSVTLYGKYWGSMMVGLEEIRRIAVFQAIAEFARLLLIGVALLVLGWRVPGLIGLWVVVGVATAVIQYGWIQWLVEERMRFQFAWASLRDAVIFGLKGHLGNMAYEAYHRLDLFFVNYTVGAAGVGQYSLAVSLAEKSWLLPNALGGAVVARIGRRSREDSTALTIKVARHTLLLGGGSVVLLAAAAPFLVPMLYGLEYAEAVVPLLILLPGVAILLLDMVISSYLTYQLGRPLLPTAAAFVILASYVPLAIYLITRWGIIGAAAASSVAYVFGALVMLALWRRYSGRPIRSLFAISYRELGAYGEAAASLIARTRSALRTRGRV